MSRRILDTWMAIVAPLVIAGSCTETTTEQTRQSRDIKAAQEPADNTARNVRDQNPNAVTPIDQGNNEKDLKITQEIRKAITGDSGLSFDAQNIKVITLDSIVTLRGPVESDSEKAAIAEKAQKVAGVARVDNQLDVKRR
jgi:hyperosmotically inducible periplasmic protein